MGNAQVKPYPRVRNKKQVHWKAADRSAPPGKPELLPETEGTPDLVTLRWSRPINDGGSPISGYLVEHRRVGSPHWVRATPLPVPFPEITLSGLEPGWRYQFRVSAENAVGYSNPSEISEPITVTFQRSAVTAPKFTQEVKDTVALENNKCEFVVHFLGQPAPKVCWFKDGFEIFSSRRIRILTEYDRSVLTIHQTSLSDEGEIKCTATNKAGHISSKSQLTVEAPPSIRLPRNYEDGLLFEIGEIIRLRVSVVGRPTPLVLWTHNGESIQDNDRYEIEYNDKSYSLKIAEAQRSDRGEYHIKAVNKLGEDIASFLVTVTDKPSPPGKARVVMALGRSVTLTWTSPNDDGGCKIGNYIVEYYRLGWNVWLKAATSRQLTTRLGDLIEGSEYKFRVKAESPYGVSEPSEESEVIFIPDPKRGLTHPSPKGRSQESNIFEQANKPMMVRRQDKPRSQSSSRVEIPPKRLDLSVKNEDIVPPVRPKRTKSKSQQHTPETTPIAPRKIIDSPINKAIFDRSSLSRDMAYGSPDFKVRKDLEPLQKRKSLSGGSDAPNTSKTPSSELKSSAMYKVKIEHPKTEGKHVTSEPKNVLGADGKRKLIREHSENVSGSSEFMLVLYSDENEQDHSVTLNFDEDSVPPPLSLSAPELSSLEQPLFPPLKNSASSTELLHERAMMRFYQAAEVENKELEKIRKAKLEKNPSLDIPKIQINSKDRDNLNNLDRESSLRRKMSGGAMTQQQAKWAQKRHSLKNPSELKNELLVSNLKKAPVSTDMKRDLMMNQNRSISEEFENPEINNIKINKQLYTQSTFERRSVTSMEELKWKEELEESFSESETESESDYERFKLEVSRGRKISLNKSIDEESDTYRPPGGLGRMKTSTSEPFEILNKRKSLPDPHFIPKPILKKVDSPSISPNISPVASPPSSPTKAARALSPRPDIVLQRNRSKSLAVPALPPLISTSSGDESDDPKIVRNRSLSLTAVKSLLSNQKELPKVSKKAPSATLSSIEAVAQISGITAASIVIPEKLLDQKRDAEAVKVVADHYDSIVRTVAERRKSNPHIHIDREKLKFETFGFDTSQENYLNSKEQTPSKENLSQDSGYQSVSSYRRSSFTDHYDNRPSFQSPISTLPAEIKSSPSETEIHSVIEQNKQNEKVPDARHQNVTNYRRSSFTDHYDFRPPYKSPIRTQPAEIRTNPFEKSNLVDANQSSKKDNWTDNKIDLHLKSYEGKNNIENKSDSKLSEQMKNESTKQEANKVNQSSIRRDSGITLQRGNFEDQIDQEAYTMPYQIHQVRKTSPTRKPKRSVGRSSSPSKRGTSITRRTVGISPIRFDSQSKLPPSNNSGKSRKSSLSPMRKELGYRREISSPSPSTIVKRNPMLKEIMTQTSGFLESLSLESFPYSRNSSFEKIRHEELLARAEVQVRSVVDWLTDLAMFAVACWLYLFKNELLAIPVLLVMVYRQLKEEIKKLIPGWITKKFKRKPKN